jgi:hypothetical protein
VEIRKKSKLQTKAHVRVCGSQQSEQKEGEHYNEVAVGFTFREWF